MKSETLVQRHPPTPPNVSSEVHDGLHHVARFNDDRIYSYDEPQRHDSMYESSVPQPFHVQHTEGYHSPSVGMGLQFDTYGQSSAYYQQDGQFNSLTNNPVVLPDSPPTPRSVTDTDEAGRRTTRSGRTVAPSSSPAVADKPRPKATPRKKSKAGKGDKTKTPNLSAPLSILTKDMTNIPVRNMEEWVNRSAEVRRQEVEKRNGYVTRPMNSFMLYRSAYAERTKQWSLQNNHQIVSSVSGESWPMEPPEIRDLYNELAKIERINHQNAHPTYKFSPSKSSAAPAKKRKGEFSDEEPSDLDDGDWNPGHRGSRIRTNRRLDRHFSYPASNISTDSFDQQFGSSGLHKGSWDITTQGRPMPMPMAMSQDELYPQFFQTNVHPSMAMQQNDMDDLRLHRVDTPVSPMQFAADHGLLGLPGGNAAEILQALHPSQAGTPLGDDEQVDPMLLYNPDTQHDLNPTVVQHPEFRNGHLGLTERELDQDSANDYFLRTMSSIQRRGSQAQSLRQWGKVPNSTHGWIPMRGNMAGIHPEPEEDLTHIAAALSLYQDY